MISDVKARYSKGAIVPLERLDIEEGANLSVSIEIEHHHEKTSSKANEQNPPDHEMFAELRLEIFGGRPVSGNSADLIREARQLRDAETEGWE